MATNTYKTIIIGAGISGLGCAHQLIENNDDDFKIISPNIGGRILESKNKTVEYGAYYIMSIYHYTSSFVKIGPQIKPTKLMFYRHHHRYNLFDQKIFTHFFQLIRLIFILRKFKKHYESFKINCLHSSQINCLKNDTYLWELYNYKAELFVKENNLKGIVYDYLAEVLHGTAFLPIKKLNAFEFLHFSLPLIVPVYEFNFKKQDAVNLINPYWIKDEVVDIKNKNGKYYILTKNKKQIYGDNIIVATSPNISKKLLKFKPPLREPAKAHMFHLLGKIKPDWNKGEENIFDDKNRMLAIAHQRDGSYLFYTKEKKPDFKRYFFNYKIIRYQYWNPAFNIGGSNLVEFNQKKNLYLIGDNNICGLEDSYIYGMYAANKILGKTID